VTIVASLRSTSNLRVWVSPVRRHRLRSPCGGGVVVDLFGGTAVTVTLGAGGILR
jgi:hypothetical protein